MTVVWPRDGAKVRFDFRIVVVAEKFGRTRFTQLSFSLSLSIYLFVSLSVFYFFFSFLEGLLSTSFRREEMNSSRDYLIVVVSSNSLFVIESSDPLASSDTEARTKAHDGVEISAATTAAFGRAIPLLGPNFPE